MKIDNRTQGYILLFLALLCFGSSAIMRAPLSMTNKILVASADMKADPFKGAVIFVVSHKLSGSMGLVVNKKKDGKYTGGPVETQKVAILHSDDATLPGSKCMKDVGLCYVEGAESEKALEALPKKPVWHMVVNGYTGWGMRQLDREVAAGQWKVVDYDSDLVMKTSPGNMWARANKRPASQLD